jgi:hypothetical protein
MIQLTIRDVDDKLREALRREAQERGLSLNRLVLQLLRESVGLTAPSLQELYHDLDELAGTWSEEEAAAFEKELAIQRTIDERLWR